MPKQNRAFSTKFAFAIIGAILALALIAAAVIFATRGTPRTPPDAGETRTFVGYITDVRARSLSELESISVVDESGASMRFHAPAGDGAFGDFTPSHAREHMLTGERVKVTYRESDGGRLVILDLADARAAPPAPF